MRLVLCFGLGFRKFKIKVFAEEHSFLGILGWVSFKAYWRFWQNVVLCYKNKCLYFHFSCPCVFPPSSSWSQVQIIYWLLWASLMAQMVKNLPTMRGDLCFILGWENSLENEMAAHSSILTWRIPWTEEPGSLQFMGLQRIRHSWATNTFTFFQWFIYIPNRPLSISYL